LGIHILDIYQYSYTASVTEIHNGPKKTGSLCVAFGIPLMRATSHRIRIDEGSNVIPIRSANNNLTGGDELTAFPGLLIAATASALFWAVFIAAVWRVARDPKRFAPLLEELSGPR
jgi:hypothetical protein